MAPSAYRGGWRSETPSGDARGQPCFHPTHPLVEEAISAAVNVGDFQPFKSLLTVLSMPYEDQPAFGRYVDPPRSDQVVHQTFCGT
jgi:uncharacterized protein YdiU (UPF0061 family)